VKTIEKVLPKLTPAVKAWVTLGPKHENWTVKRVCQHLLKHTGENVDPASVEKHLRSEGVPVRYAAGSDENLLVNLQAKAAPRVVQSVEEEIERSAGFQPNPRIRKAVELHAMRWAEKEFEKRQYKVDDVSQKRPYDLHCSKSNEVRYIEVKGTQGNGLDIVLTAGEVKFIEKNKANCVLCVVHGIEVRGKRNPKASGGRMSMVEPFDLADGLLKPLAFTFRRKT
jgi:hypothetical protein